MLIDDHAKHFPIAEDDTASTRYATWLSNFSDRSLGLSNESARVIEPRHAGPNARGPYTSGKWEKLPADGKIALTRACIQETAAEPPAPTYPRQ